MITIEEELRDAIDKIQWLEDVATRTELINYAQDLLMKVSPFKRQPVSNVKWVRADLVEPNDYNPNAVAPPEMRLLHTSIAEDGFTQPIVVNWNADRKKYIVIDGYHRTLIGKDKKDIRRKLKGFLPVVILDKTENERMASTIRHNRARGAHAISEMASIVRDLYKKGWSDEQIAEYVGMNNEEILRLKQFTGLPELFKDRDFSKSWV